MKTIAVVLFLLFTTVTANAQCGIASWYGGKSDGLHGKRTASGEIFNTNSMTAAHRTLPFGTKVKVTTPKGNSVTVKINDRGPFHKGRIIDLSRAAANKLGIDGVGKVCIKKL